MGQAAGGVLALAALASSEADQDPIDVAIRAAAANVKGDRVVERLVRFVPFDPATKTAEAFTIDRDGRELRVIKGAFEIIAKVAESPADTRRRVDDLAEHGHRIIAVAAGPPHALQLVGLVALSDPPREDLAGLIATLRDMNVRTVMVTGDFRLTAAAIARKVGIAGTVCPPERISEELSTDQYGVFARVLPDQKYRLVKALQSHGHVVGMCGDGTNDAPALRQAQIGIAVSTATDVAKAAAGMVMTEPGLAGIVFAIREGRVAFQRLLAYAFNMLVKKSEKFRLGLSQGELQTLAFITLVFGNQGLLYVLRERRRMWRSKPGSWVLASSAADIVAVSVLALSGILMELLPWQFLAAVFLAAAGFALILDQIKLSVTSVFNVE